MKKIILKFGDRGTLVSILQSKLGLKKTTTYFGNTTKGLVEKYQAKVGLQVTGEADLDLMTRLGIENPEKYLSTDVKTQASTVVNKAVEKYENEQPVSSVVVKLLNADEYFSQRQTKRWLFLHHTAGSHNPVAVVSGWENDTRGRIATEFVIGGKSINGKDDNWDGVVVRCMSSGGWAYHLGDNGNSHLHPESIGIEICNYGWVTKGGYKKNNTWIAGDPNKFYTYVGSTIPADQVVTLDKPWRGYQHWHKYTDKQLEALAKLMKDIFRDNPTIDPEKGLKEWLSTQSPEEAFSFKPEAYNGSVKGVLTHANTRKDKTDCSPQPNLIAVIKNMKSA